MTTTTTTSSFSFSKIAFASASMLLLLVSTACGQKPGTGLIPDASMMTVGSPDAGAVVADVSACAACQTGATAPQAWTFAGIYRDAACTDPLAQMDAAQCAQIPAVGPVSLTYVDDVGSRKANEAAQVTLSEQVAPEAPRYRKAGTKCVPANEAATNITPLNCGGFRVCRDANGALQCAATACRTFTNGCPDFEETRMYAAVNDPGKTAVAPAGGGNLARLRQCCTALAAQAKTLGSSPEAGMVNSAAQQCLALVAAAGPNGTAPELGALKTILAGRNLPAVCAGF